MAPTQRHWNKNKGKCGICGDAWDLPEPRPHEDGGKYGKGIVVKTYQRGQNTTIEVLLTAVHGGYFEFRLCPVTPDSTPDQDCLDRYLLPLADGSGYRRSIPRDGSRPGLYNTQVTLPKDLTCDRCVLQWHYYTGNSWGRCNDGKRKEGMGCGPQETFRGCADIAIV
ncbi:hypothetical protein LAZ67_22001435 [Cordylochernes scorpioides]|uniref:Chitin-binding type-4 domain-containing protein n=1 Tax=Cordylochernes scorpioides TaxID=51811 RepID=A0ABY6LP00_9ARAC|nr:hypothetical protein LAZ67_22001435 [Cordylochernes scorpioides]